MKKIIILIAFFGTLSFGFAQSKSTFFKAADNFFKANVSNGKVAYSKINAHPETLNMLIDLAESVSVSKK